MMYDLTQWLTDHPELMQAGLAVIVPALVKAIRSVGERVRREIPDQLLPPLAIVLGEILGQLTPGVPAGAGAVSGGAAVGLHQLIHQRAKALKAKRNG